MFSNGILTSKVHFFSKFQYLLFFLFSICLFAAAHSQAMPIIANLFVYRLVAVKWWIVNEYHCKIFLTPYRIRFYTPFNTALLLLVCVFVQKILWWDFYILHPLKMICEVLQLLVPIWIRYGTSCVCTVIYRPGIPRTRRRSHWSSVLCKLFVKIEIIEKYFFLEWKRPPSKRYCCHNGIEHNHDILDITDHIL